MLTLRWKQRLKKVGSMLMAVVLVFSGGAWVFPAKSYADAPYFDSTPVFDPASTGYSYRIPGLAVTNAGTVLAFAEERLQPGDADPHNIVLRRSTDQGKTWGALQVIEASTNNESWTNPVPVIDRSTGDIFLFYAKNNGNNSSQVFYRKNSDDGATWSGRTEITGLFAGDPESRPFHLPGPGHGIQLQNGRLMVQVWHRHGVSLPVAQREYGVSVVYSDDGGSTWQAGGYVPVDANYPINESRIVELANGDIVVNGRYAASGTHRRIVAFSDDGGATWSAPEFDEAIRSFSAVDASLIRFTQSSGGVGTNRLLFSRPDHPTSRMNLTVDVSYDEGASWTYSKVVDSGAAAYSDMAVLPDNTVVLLYEKGSNMIAARFNIEWLTDGKDNLIDGPTFPLVYEAEDLNVSASSGDTLSIYYDANASGGAVLRYLSGAVGDYVSLDVDVPQAGTYEVKVRSRTATNRAQLQLLIDGTNQGAVFDPYSATVGYQEFDLGTVTFTSPGTKVFMFLATGKNASSTGYAIFPDSITLIPQSPILVYEAESLNVSASSGDTLSVYYDASASGGAVLRYLGDAVGDYVALDVEVPKAGTYEVKVRSRTATNRAQLQLLIDGTNQGAVFDPYSATVGYQEFDLDTVTFTSPGTKVFTFLATGKNASSTGYGIFPDSITLIPQ
jgi:sialidase-1